MSFEEDNTSAVPLWETQDDWEDGFDFGEFEDMQPVAASASRPGQERAQRNLGNLRTHVQYAMKAFQGMLAASVLGEDQQGVLDGGGSYGEQTVHGHAGVESCFSGPHEPLVRAALGGNAGGDIDDMLNSRENAGECVLSPSLDADQDTEWNIPDLNLIFRPPKFLMEAMAIGISPGNWVKLAPTAAAGNSKWKTLKTVLSTGLAFKQGAQDADLYSEEERDARKKQLQLDVEQLKNFLLSTTKAWEDLLVEMDDGYGGIRSRTSSPPPLANGASGSHSEDSFKRVRPDLLESLNGGGFEDKTTLSIADAIAMALPVLEPKRGIPQRSAVAVKGIATGICQLFNGLPAQSTVRAGGLLDIDALASAISCPYPSDTSDVQILEVCGRIPPKSAGANDKVPAESVKATRLNNVCAFKMKVQGGGDNVTLRIWANGKTQTSGCKDRGMLLAVNSCICQAIANISAHNMRHNLPRVIRGDAQRQEEALSHLAHIRVLSAHILGSWNVDLRSVGAKLDMGNLCEFLAGDRFGDRVFKVSHVKPKGNSARFNNLSLYVRRECLTQWKDDGSDQTTVYVNVYEAGKCSVLAAPDAEVAEELADIVCGMLFEALQHDHIRIDVDYAAAAASKKHRAT
eukprot:CAMPEP_0179431410 /NCGR_PEP_ID=MMETSP0799-20121207/16305_1 /TAXON_ID=46947 /ORGANISM="Geminigera cryophila, Strain CCMP2564" /LENGTH=628 /DNA_ID=CAMNT_0021208323 /DNA_START=186 /DNA_END=2073 /DNA_ORIENTATION=+